MKKRRFSTYWGKKGENNLSNGYDDDDNDDLERSFSLHNEGLIFVKIFLG